MSIFSKILDLNMSDSVSCTLSHHQKESSNTDSSYYQSFLLRASKLWSTTSSLFASIFVPESKPDNGELEKFKYHHDKAKKAKTYEEWFQASYKLDQLEGNTKWIEDPQSTQYDWKLLQSRIDEINLSREVENDRRAMTFTMKLGQTRNLGDMCNYKLYGRSRVGTKKLIADYTDKIIEQLEWIGDVNVDGEKSNDDMSLKERHDYFMTIRQSYGRTALMLSGGGTLGFFHLGVIRALVNARLLPRIISGASTGSIMASLICTSKEEDRMELLNSPTSLPREVFEYNDAPDTKLLRLKRYLTEGNLYDPSHLKSVLYDRIGDITFQEAYNLSRLILNITVSSDSLFDMPRLLNYVTSPDVVIWSAVLASCAVPLVFPAQEILVKTKSGKLMPWTSTFDKYRDGSIDNDLPLKRISEMFSINHFVVVQLNPHIAPFLYKGFGEPSLLRKGINFALQMLKEEVQHRCTQLKELGIAPNGVRRLENVITQRYLGDITMAPELSFSDVGNILRNPKIEFITEFISKGERAAWQKMAIIKHSLRIELAIDSAIYKLRSKLLGESPQIPMEIPVESDYLMALRPSNSTKYIGHSPSSPHHKNETNPHCLTDCYTCGDDADEASKAPIFGNENDTLSPMTPQIPPTPLWQTENFEQQLSAFEGKRKTSFSVQNGSYLLNAHIRKNSLLPHDISRRGSNVSIRDISPSTSTKYERRKQITSTQFFISPDFEWGSSTSIHDFENSVSLLARKGAESEAKTAARKNNGALSIRIP